MILLCSWLGLRWVLEQPSGSSMESLPVFQDIWAVIRAPRIHLFFIRFEILFLMVVLIDAQCIDRFVLIYIYILLCIFKIYMWYFILIYLYLNHIPTTFPFPNLICDPVVETLAMTTVGLVLSILDGQIRRKIS